MNKKIFLSLAAIVILISLSASAQRMEGTGFIPFSAGAVDLKIATQGIGFDAAVPIFKRLNVRGGANFASIGATYSDDGVKYSGNLQLRNAQGSVDLYPFGNSFRLSGGMQMYNANNIHAHAYVPGGTALDLDGTTLYSSVASPVTGSGWTKLGNAVAPLVSFGWGNILRPEFAGRLSVPVELGFVYMGQPSVNLVLSGITCLRQADATMPVPGRTCTTIAGNPQTQAEVVREQTRLSDDLGYLRFYPIVSVGLGFRF